MNKKFLGASLKRLRKLKRFTLDGLAKAVDSTNAYLSQLETGKRGNPSSDLVARIATVLDVPVESFFDDEVHDNLTKNLANALPPSAILPSPHINIPCPNCVTLVRTLDGLNDYNAHLKAENAALRQELAELHKQHRATPAPLPPLTPTPPHLLPASHSAPRPKRAPTLPVAVLS